MWICHSLALNCLCVLLISLKVSYATEENISDSDIDLETEDQEFADDEFGDGEFAEDNITDEFSADEEPVPLNYDEVINTYKNLNNWTDKEDLLLNVFERRLEQLEKELKVIDEYIIDYQTTTGDAILHAKIPLETSKKRAELIASSGIAVYRMTYRYVHMLQNLKKLIANNEKDNELLKTLWKMSPKSQEELEMCDEDA